MQQISITVSEPILSLTEYAKRTGESLKAVQHLVDRGLLPFVQPISGGKRYVNMTALALLTLESVEQKDDHNKVIWSN